MTAWAKARIIRGHCPLNDNLAYQQELRNMIRIATEADVPAILSIYAPYVEHTTVSFEYDKRAKHCFARYFLLRKIIV